MNNVVECEGMQLTLPMGQLFENTLLKVNKVEAPGEPSDIYDFTEYPFVLREAATLSLTLNGCRKYADRQCNDFIGCHTRFRRLYCLGDGMADGKAVKTSGQRAVPVRISAFFRCGGAYQ